MRKLKKYKPTKFMAKTSHYDKDAADYAVMFIESLCHTKGTWAGKPFELIDWQEQIIRDLFGVLKPNGYRQFNTAYIEIGKKNGKQLALAKEKINHLIELTGDLYASDMHELMFIYELKERLTVCLSVIAHLGARKETRWHSFAENLDYPGKSDDWMKYVNSRYENGQLHMIYRELVGREARYEHND